MARAKQAQADLPLVPYIAKRAGRNAFDPRRHYAIVHHRVVETTVVAHEVISICEHISGLGFVLLGNDLAHLANDVRGAREFRDVFMVKYRGR